MPRKKGDKRWCTRQMEFSDIDGCGCLAHLAEGHIFRCPYTEDEVDPDLGLPVHKPIPTKGGDGVCRDYESYVEKVTKRLMGEEG